MTKPRHRAIRLTTEPYKYDVYIFEAPAKQGARWFKKYVGEIQTDGVAGYTGIPSHESCIYVWLEQEASLGILAHELIHCTMAILAGSGVPITRANEETIAYLHSHLLEKALAALGRQREARKMAQIVAEGRGIKAGCIECGNDYAEGYCPHQLSNAVITTPPGK